jgi:hypothetical protein
MPQMRGGSTPDSFATYNEIERWAPIVTGAGASLE